MQKSSTINVSIVEKKLNMYFPIATVMIGLILFSTSSAYALNYTSSMFSDAQRYADSNTYKNSNYGFSIQPPLNWVKLNNLPQIISNQTIVAFSNNDKSQLSTFVISHIHIGQNVIDAINSHSDNDIIATISRELLAVPSTDSKIEVYNGIVDRYNDGIRVVIGSRTQYTVDNSTTLNENVFYFLNNGNLYKLEMTSNPNTILKNSQLFEDSASTFLVNQINPVPEFPTSLIILITAMFLVIFISRTIKSRGIKSIDFR